MNTNMTTIESLRAAWVHKATSTESVDALAALVAAEPTLMSVPADNLGDLVVLLARPGALDNAELFSVMLRGSPVDPLVTEALLIALIPGLIQLARRLAWGEGGEWESGSGFFADLSATAWEVLFTWAGENRRYAAGDVLSAVKCRLQRRLRAHRRDLQRRDALAPEAIEPIDSARVAALDFWNHPRVGSSDKALIYAHEALGYSYAELAALTGTSRHTLRHRAARAAQCLVA